MVSAITESSVSHAANNGRETRRPRPTASSCQPTGLVARLQFEVQARSAAARIVLGSASCSLFLSGSSWRLFTSVMDVPPAAARTRSSPVARMSTRAADRRRNPGAGRLAETPKWSYRLFPLPFHEACCFLDDEARCTIYPTRPQVCREFAAGSEDCQRVRSLRGLAPLEPVQRPADDPCRTEPGELGH